MSEETNTPDQTQETQAPQYTEKELKEMRTKATSFYKEEVKHLQPQAQYYKLLAEITENKYKADLFKHKHGEFYMQQAQHEAEMQSQQKAYEEALANGEIDEEGNLTEKGQKIMDDQALKNVPVPEGEGQMEGNKPVKEPRKLQGQ